MLETSTQMLFAKHITLKSSSLLKVHSFNLREKTFERYFVFLCISEKFSDPKTPNNMTDVCNAHVNVVDIATYFVKMVINYFLS